MEATLETLNEQFKLLQIERDTEVDALSKQVNHLITAFFPCRILASEKNGLLKDEVHIIHSSTKVRAIVIKIIKK